MIVISASVVGRDLLGFALPQKAADRRAVSQPHLLFGHQEVVIEDRVRKITLEPLGLHIVGQFLLYGLIRHPHPHNPFPPFLQEGKLFLEGAERDPLPGFLHKPFFILVIQTVTYCE